MTMWKIAATAAALGVGLAGCGEAAGGGWAGTVDTLASGGVVVNNPAAGLWTDAERWTVEEDLRIGSAMSEGPDLFAGLTGMVVTADGAIHVLDRQAKELKRFSAAGEHEWTAGGEGGGPGEFRDPIGLALGPAGRLWIADAGNARYATYAPTGEAGEDYRRALGGYSLPWSGGFDAEGRFHEQTVSFSPEGTRHGVIRMDTLLVPTDTFWYPEYDAEQFIHTSENGRIGAGVPYAPYQRREWDRRGYMWVGVNYEYAITQLTMSGDTVMVVRKPAGERVSVTAEEEREAVEGLDWFVRQGGRVEPGRIPSVKPVYSSFTVSPAGRLWVRLTPRPEEEGARYDVFGPDGRYLGEVRAPSVLRYPAFADGRIHTIAADSLGVQNVVRWRVGRTGGDEDD